MADDTTDVVVCSVRDVDATGARGFAVGAGDWPLRGLVLRDATGQLQAYVDRCPHAGHPLALKDHDFLTPDRAFIKCSSHGALFARDSGVCIAGPCPGRALQRLQVRVDGENVRIAPPV